MRHSSNFSSRARSSIPPFLSVLLLFWIYWWRLKSNVLLIDVRAPSEASVTNKVGEVAGAKPAAAAQTSIIQNKTSPDRDSSKTSDDRTPLEPIRILEEYKKQHSNAALLDEVNGNDPGMSTRRFALVSYWCPDRAGNILHNLFNSMAWAILTNRTILWQYSSHQNTEEQCQQVMKRADWLPSWDIWSKTLQLESPREFPWNEVQANQPQVVIFPQIPDVLHAEKSIDRNSWRDDPLQRPQDRAHIESMGPEIAARAASLYSEGVDFLLGLLFRETFEFLVGDQIAKSPDGVSIALHSRHPVNGDDGSFVNEEKQCLSQLLTKHLNSPRNKGPGCHVYLMSDRQATVDLLGQWVQKEFNCTPVVASHSSSHAQKTEHGPWDGVGFIEDLASASLARTAAVGDICRSSFMLMAELVDYEQRLAAWKQDRPTKALEICKLQNKQLTGYDYGPGTPTFIRHNTRPELAPVKALKDYKKLHSQSIIEKMQDDKREYLVFNYSCLVPASGSEGDGANQFLNNIIYAIATNRTIVLNHTLEDDCLDIQNLHSWIPLYDDNTLPPNWLDTSYSLPKQSSKVDSKDVQQGVFSLPSRESQDIAKALFSEGSDFLYGMVFLESFHLAGPIQEGIPEDYETEVESALNTVALYMDDSDSIEDTIQCLDTTIDSNLPCNVYMMWHPKQQPNGSRQHVVVSWLSKRNCTVWEAMRYNTDDEMNTTTKTGESNIKLFRDLHFVGKAKSAFIGPLDAYSEILIEWIVYRRKTKIWKDGRFPPIHSPNLTKCFI